VVGVLKQRSHRNVVDMEEHKQRAIEGTEVVNNIYLYDVALTYAVTRRFNLTVAAPFQHATRQRGTSTQVFHSSGIGDISMMGRFWLFKPPSESGQNISFGVGLKLPTGKPGLTDTTTLANGTRVTSVVDQSIQLGDGGRGIPLDIQAYKRIRKTTIYASGSYLLNPRDM